MRETGALSLALRQEEANQVGAWKTERPMLLLRIYRVHAGANRTRMPRRRLNQGLSRLPVSAVFSLPCHCQLSVYREKGGN